MITARLVRLLAAASMVGTTVHAQGPASLTPGAVIVRAMHDRYAGRWYRTLTFVQATTRWDSVGRATVTTWYESALIPSRLRIDFGSPKDGNGVLFTADSTYSIKNGQVVRMDSGGNGLTTLLLDVYANPVAQTVASLRASEYDLATIHRETWEGRPVYVVGAAAGDLTTPQFWVDVERLVEVRQIGPVRRGSPRTLDAQFSNYVRAGGGWIAVKAYFLIDGKPRQLEEYSDVRADVPLDAALFDPRQWMTAPHWAPRS
jgi:hypothetical protein